MSPSSNAANRDGFVIAGYLPDYRADALDPAVGKYVSDVMYFSVEPKPTGDLDLSRLRPDLLRRLQTLRRQNGVRVLLTAGGWGHSAGFAPMTNDPAACRRFVITLARFCRENGLDGADMDWEHPQNAAEQRNYANLLTETRAVFHRYGLLITAALAGWQNVPPDGLEALDRIHLMAYDHPDRHATFEQAQKDVDQFLRRGVSPGKIVLGVPFYGRRRAKSDDAMAYADIMRRWRPAPAVDEVEGMYFNGPTTLARKTRWARENGLGGVMIWEVGQDLPPTDSASLLRAVHAAGSARAGQR